jgi:hypothetical protein
MVCLVAFTIYFGFAMSEKYGTPAFPIHDNIFQDNAGRIFYKHKNNAHRLRCRFRSTFLGAIRCIYYCMGKSAHANMHTMVRIYVRINYREWRMHTVSECDA